jgi:glycosyltransferase involved in cell wall biosynthesis
MAERLKVLHVITRLTLGGSAENTIDSVVALERAGYDVILATGGEAEEIEVVESARARGCRIVPVPALVRNLRPLHDLRALWSLFGLIRLERFQIVHTHTSKAGFVGRVAAWLARVPVIVHTPHGHVFWGYFSLAYTRLFVWLERLAARLTDRLVMLTEGELEDHGLRKVGRPEQYVVIPSGVNLDKVRLEAPSREVARLRLGVGPEALLVAGAGRLIAIKGFQTLIGAFPAVAGAVPAARLVIAGEGPLRGALLEEARALGVSDRVEIKEGVDGVWTVLSAGDLVVVPSLNEGMGRVVVEAMALGRAVVASAVGGIPTVVIDGETGLLVPPEDPEALARAVIELLKSAERRALMGEAGRRRAEEFSLPVMERRLLDLYRDLLAEKGLPCPSAS